MQHRLIGHAQNVEHARTLLLQLEHSTTQPATKAKKTALQQDLQAKRELIKRLNQRLIELNEVDDGSSEGSVEDDSEDEDADQFPSYAPRVRENAGLDVKAGGEGNEALQAAAQGLTSEIRRRQGRDDGTRSGATATGNALFGPRGDTTSQGTNVDTNEALLQHNRQEQEGLTNSLLEMAKQLKQQSLHFGQTLEGEKSILDRAVQGLDRSTLGMEAASQRMGTLRRMTEGRGWWARLKLYGLIFVLWVLCFLIVFVGPKIRF